MKISKEQRNKKCVWLTTKPIAHRGLWGNGITENSINAYQNAVKNGYPIEIDLYKSKDGVLFSFHDKNLKRMTGLDANIFDLSSGKIRALKLQQTDEHIPTFDEVLQIVNGKVPILVEIKDQPDKTAVDDTVNKLKGYNGEFAIQSFNPLYIKRVKQLAPNFIRGILATNDKEDLHGKSFITKFIIKHTALNFLIKPDFISYNKKGFPLTGKKIKLAWTIENQNEYDNIKTLCDNIIFENFIPKK